MKRGIEVSENLKQVREHLERLKEAFKDSQKHVVIMEDVHFLWERDKGETEDMLNTLEYLAEKTYEENSNVMFVLSFSYPGVVRSQKLRHSMIKQIHDNKTGICFSYEDDWAIDSSRMGKHKSKLKTSQPPAGRGFWVFKGVEQELQAFYYPEKQNG